MTSISENVYIDKLGDVVNEYNNAYHRKIRMKPLDVKDNTYIDSMELHSNEDPNLEVGDHVRIPRYKNIFAKGCTPNWSEEIFVIKKVKNLIPWTNVINDLNGNEIIGTCFEKELQKTNQQEFRTKKVIKKKSDKLFIKWKGCDSSFNRYKNIFPKGYTPNWSEDVFVIKKVKNTVAWTNVINDLNGDQIIGIFFEKGLQKTNQQKFRIKKVIKKKGDKLFVKWKGCDSSFNSWIDKKDLV